MKVSGIIIDESLQQKVRLNGRKGQERQAEEFPSQAVVESTAESFSTVVEQAVITQDRPLLKEILLECQQKLIKNTVVELNVAKVSKMLGMLQEYLYSDCHNAERYCAWIQEIAKRHVGVILSNQQNRQVIARIRNYLQKRTGQRTNLLAIRDKLNGKDVKGQSRVFVPKFSYVESKSGDKMEDEEEKLVLDDDFDFEGDMMDEFEQ